MIWSLLFVWWTIVDCQDTTFAITTSTGWAKTTYSDCPDAVCVACQLGSSSPLCQASARWGCEATGKNCAQPMNASKGYGNIIPQQLACKDVFNAFGFQLDEPMFISPVLKLASNPKFAFDNAIQGSAQNGIVNDRFLSFPSEWKSAKVCPLSNDRECPTNTKPATDCTFTIPHLGGNMSCLVFKSFPEGNLTDLSPSLNATTMRVLNDNELVVSVDGTEVTFTDGAVATTANGTQLQGLMLSNGTFGLFFSACGPLIVVMWDGVDMITVTSVVTTGVGARSSKLLGSASDAVSAMSASVDIWILVVCTFAALLAGIVIGALIVYFFRRSKGARPKNSNSVRLPVTESHYATTAPWQEAHSARSEYGELNTNEL